MKKLPIWDLLTGVVLLAIVCLSCGFILVFVNPASSPLQAEPTYTQVFLLIPSATQEVMSSAGKSLPPTWTPVVAAEEIIKPTLRASSTPLATSTLFVANTRTPLPTATPTVTLTPANAKCYVISESPQDNTAFSAGQEFDKRWTVKNNSGKTWESANLDIRYKSGTKLQTGADAYDLSRNVSSGTTIDVTIRMRAPSSPNTYTSYWSITDGSTSYCSFFAQIVVK